MPKVAADHLIALGRAVRAARIKKGETLKELGFNALNNNTSQAHLSRIEQGKRQISPLTAGKLVTYLGLPDELLQPFLGPDAPAQDEVTPEDIAGEHLIQKAAADPSTPPTAEALLIALAYEFAASGTGNLETAYNDLRGALEAAAELKRRAALPSNLSDQVKATLAEVDRLNEEEQDFAAARALLETDLARLEDEVAERNQARMALLDTAIDQARLMNDPDGAAAYVLTRLALDPAPSPFAALRAERRRWYEEGRDKGRAFDLDVAIALARASKARATNPDERGAALNDLAIALRTLGERNPGTEKLDEAVTAYREALKERTRDRVPLDWAMTQMNLGNALRTLGERDPGTERLDEAVAAYREALKEHTRDRVPLDWATTQMNLGAALQTLGTRDPGTERLDEAVTAYREALKERTRDRVPLQWAMTQMNLAITELALHRKAPDPARLADAQARVAEARAIFTEGAPLYVEKADALLAAIDTAIKAG